MIVSSNIVRRIVSKTVLYSVNL